MTGLDVSRSDTDKSIVILKKFEGFANCEFSCVALDGTNIVRFIDFPIEELEQLVNISKISYPYGIEFDSQPDDLCKEIVLKVCKVAIKINRPGHNIRMY